MRPLTHMSSWTFLSRRVVVTILCCCPSMLPPLLYNASFFRQDNGAHKLLIPCLPSTGCYPHDNKEMLFSSRKNGLSKLMRRPVPMRSVLDDDTDASRSQARPRKQVKTNDRLPSAAACDSPLISMNLAIAFSARATSSLTRREFCWYVQSTTVMSQRDFS